TLAGVEKSSNGTAISFDEPAGSYNYTLGAVPGWKAATDAGSITVSGTTGISIVWTVRLYLVTVTETGLPTGTPWAITLDRATHNVSLSSVSVPEANGTHTFGVQAPPGFSVDRSSGTVVVVGSAAAVNLTFSAGGSTHASSFPLEPVAALVAVVGIVAVVGVLWLRGRKDRTALPPGAQ
ncbi:MAG: hypothetical protein L3K02_03780, partial [Thermoplasmata archaeon]|nr:hypothetical protein [Thermoplasmata archaeon]